jgi:hypothetical protein
MDAVASKISKRYPNLLDVIAEEKSEPGFCLGPSSGDDGLLGPSVGDDALTAPATNLGPCVGDDIVGAPTTRLGPSVGDDQVP